MTLCDKIEVHYINIDSKTKESNKDVYLVDDMQLSPNGEDVVVFSWLISPNATKLAGTLNFRITFKCISEPSIIDYQMSTEIFKGITVSDGISNGEAVIEEYSDVLEQWKQELQAGVSESINYVNKIINYEIKWNDGGYISKDDGSVNTETGSSYSDYVAVRPGTKLIITNTMTTKKGYNAFYGPNDTFLSSFPNATGEVVVPDGAVKMRLSKYSTETLSVASNVKTYIDDSIEKVEANAKLTDDAVNELKGDLVGLTSGCPNIAIIEKFTTGHWYFEYAYQDVHYFRMTDIINSGIYRIEVGLIPVTFISLLDKKVTSISKDGIYKLDTQCYMYSGDGVTDYSDNVNLENAVNLLKIINLDYNHNETKTKNELNYIKSKIYGNKADITIPKEEYAIVGILDDDGTLDRQFSDYRTTYFIPIDNIKRIYGVGFPNDVYSCMNLYDENLNFIQMLTGEYDIDVKDIPNVKYFRASISLAEDNPYNCTVSYMDKNEISLFDDI